MNKSGRVLTVLVVLLALFSAVGCERLRARDQLNKGVQSYKNAHYEEAIEHFKNAVELDPSLINARLYLATAYCPAIHPRRRFARQQSICRAGHRRVQKGAGPNPPKEQQIHSLKGIASLYFNMKKMDQAREYH